SQAARSPAATRLRPQAMRPALTPTAQVEREPPTVQSPCPEFARSSNRQRVLRGDEPAERRQTPPASACSSPPAPEDRSPAPPAPQASIQLSTSLHGSHAHWRT